MKKGITLVALILGIGLLGAFTALMTLGQQASSTFSKVETKLQPSGDSPQPTVPAIDSDPGPGAMAKGDGPIGRSGKSGNIDRILEKLDWGNIAFNAPDAMKLRQAGVIQLLLSGQESAENLQAQIKAKGPRESARIQISDRMEARLTGHGFDIVAITPELQAVSHEQTTEWKWEIKPTETGKHHLYLTLSAILHIDGERTSRTIRTFDRDIEVQVSWSDRMSGFLGSYWQWLWTTVLVPVGLWAYGKRGGEKGKAGEKAA